VAQGQRSAAEALRVLERGLDVAKGWTASLPHIVFDSGMPVRVAAAVLSTLGLTTLVGCGGSASPTVPQQRLTKLGLVAAPPVNLSANCKAVAQHTNLTVYCPPIVPKGRVEAHLLKNRHGNAYSYGEKGDYGLSLSSRSLALSRSAFARDPDAEGHWVVMAAQPAKRIRALIDNRFRNPHYHYSVKARHFTDDGVRATVLPWPLATGSFANADHLVVYWMIGNTFYAASAHAVFFRSGRTSSGQRRTTDHSRHYEPIVAAIARGLIEQTVDCGPQAADPTAPSCAWVYPGGR
jgi:hypothetical protein